jgi:hypothetical protein
VKRKDIKMSSQNKKNKGKNSYTYGDHALKETFKLKRLNFFNSSLRHKLKKDLNKEINNE